MFEAPTVSSQDEPTTLGSNWSLHHVFCRVEVHPPGCREVTVACVLPTSDFLLVEMLCFFVAAMFL